MRVYLQDYQLRLIIWKEFNIKAFTINLPPYKRIYLYSMIITMYINDELYEMDTENLPEETRIMVEVMHSIIEQNEIDLDVMDIENDELFQKLKYSELLSSALLLSSKN